MGGVRKKARKENADEVSKNAAPNGDTAAGKADIIGKNTAASEDASTKTETDGSAKDKYGLSALMLARKGGNMADLTKVKDLTAILTGRLVWIRVHLQSSRAEGKQCVFVLRQQ
ncbi:hypothetical protein RvY_10839 [Ramazzottius varieornatus]|uniref:Uncharacterized protein n=1 Tax=Ramazzottius varieornatus TaxID=947166 RepID=A0A1D1VE29_RAMVA|nr:hypothetical protein RvY_10839 [Ramazzottius varieornatus]